MGKPETIGAALTERAIAYANHLSAIYIEGALEGIREVWASGHHG